MALSYSFLSRQALPRLLNAQGVLGVEADGLGVVGDGLVVLLLVAPGDAAVVERDGVLGVEADGLGVVGDGLVVLLLVAQAMPRLLNGAAYLGSRRMASV